MFQYHRILILTLVQVVALSLAEKASWHDDPFHHIENLDSRGDYVLEWTVNWTNRTVTFNVTARTTGYVGFGLTSNGTMFGGDVVMGGVSPSGEPYFHDMHVLFGRRRPVEDDSQDYILHSAWENETHTSLAFSRPFETCDPHDFKINDDTIQFIWSFGRVDDITQYHSVNRGQFKAYVLDPDYTPRAILEAKRTGQQLTEDELGDLRVWTMSREQPVPAAETAYWCSFNKAPVLEKKHHLVGFDFRWENEVQFRHTHHVLLFKCKAPEGEDPVQFFQPYVQNNTGEMCFFLFRGESGGLPTQYCREIVYAYAVGAKPFFMPSHTGMPFGDNPDEYYLLQVHYDNPDRIPNLVFNINVDLYYTPNLREHDAGLATIGHQTPGSPSILVPPNSTQHSIYGHCGSSCTNEMIPPEGINIIGTHQHTHNSGVRHRVHHFRGREELPWIVNDDNFDNQFQPTRMNRNEIKFLPGDHIMTRCVYDNTWVNGSAVVGGFSTRQEMCVVYIWYYNRLPNYSLCRSQITSRTYLWKHLGVRNFTWSDPDLEYTVTDPEELEGLTIGQVARDEVEWTPKRRKALQRDHMEWPQMNYCDTLDNLATRGEGEPRPVEYPSGAIEYRMRDGSKRLCQSRGRTKKNKFNYI